MSDDLGFFAPAADVDDVDDVDEDTAGDAHAGTGGGHGMGGQRRANDSGDNDSDDDDDSVNTNDGPQMDADGQAASGSAASAAGHAAADRSAAPTAPAAGAGSAAHPPVQHAPELFSVGVDSLDHSPVASLAKSLWLADGGAGAAAFDAAGAVTAIWTDHLAAAGFPLQTTMLLDTLGYLEQYLLPNYGASKTGQPHPLHTLSIVLMLNEKFRRRRSDPWTSVFGSDPSKFATLFGAVLKLLVPQAAAETPKGKGKAAAGAPAGVSLDEKRFMIVFLINCFGSLEVAFVRAECLRVVGISIWHNLVNETVLQEKLAEAPERAALWERAEKRFASAKPAAKEKMLFERTVFSQLIAQFMAVLESVPLEGPASADAVAFSERFVEFLIDLEAQLPTRRHVNAVIHDHQVISTCLASNLYRRSSQSAKSSKGQTGPTAAESWGMRTYTIGPVFKTLVDRLSEYAHFPIDDATGSALSQTEVVERFYERVYGIQRVLFAAFRDSLGDVAVASVCNMDRAELREHFAALATDELHSVCTAIGVRTVPVGLKGAPSSVPHSRDFLVNVICRILTKPQLRLDKVGMLPLYPTETTLFDETVCPPNDVFSNTHCTALPKLSLQYLTLKDYLLRNLVLYTHDSVLRLRDFVEDTVMRLSPSYNRIEGSTVFEGSVQKAVAIDQFQVAEARPSFVKGEIVFSVHKMSASARQDWDTIRQGDHLFLMGIYIDPSADPVANRTAPLSDMNTPGSGAQFRKRFGIMSIRGCEVCELLGDNGRPVDDYMSAQVERRHAEDSRPRINRRQRSMTVLLDPNQYLIDTAAKNAPQYGLPGAKDVYDTFNVLVRVPEHLNNVKAVLETTAEALQSDVALPEWLQDLFLGYGDRNSAHFSQIESPSRSVHVGHAFADWAALEQSFPDWTLVSAAQAASPAKKQRGSKAEQQHLEPPYMLVLPESVFSGSVPETAPTGSKRGKDESSHQVVVHSAKSHDKASGMLSVSLPPHRALGLTPLKVTAAIVSGSLHGLTLTSVAAQVAANIARGNPAQRTLVVAPTRTHLVRLLSQINACGIDERYMVSVSHGFGELRADTDEALGKLGRVNHLLARRRTLLGQVNRLAESLGATGAHGSTCETAHYFNTYGVVPAWERFMATVEKMSGSVDGPAVAEMFPFAKFFAETPVGGRGRSARRVQPDDVQEQEQAIAESAQVDDDEIATDVAASANKDGEDAEAETDEQQDAVMEDATPESVTAATTPLALLSSATSKESAIFAELVEIRPLELLRGRRDRTSYVIAKQARIVGITARDLPLKRRELLRLGVHCENVVDAVMAPLAGGGLKRIVLTGDPVQQRHLVRSQALSAGSNLSQSLLGRLVKLGVPTVALADQGRSRPSIAALYAPLYTPFVGPVGVLSGDGPLASVATGANAGFAFEAQAVDVPEFLGRGESEPRKGFYQNLGEAEYIVAVFQYMRLIGYPASRIAILTPYKGQRELIQDVLVQRCSWNAYFGSPGLLSTVDEAHASGAKADIVLLSLVRTRTLDPVLCDDRRLVSAVSVARLGLYVFCRTSVHLERLSAAGHASGKRLLDGLAQRPVDLWLRVGEKAASSGVLVQRAVDDTGVAGAGKDAAAVAGAGEADVVRMAGVQHMGRYVHQMAQEQMEWLQQHPVQFQQSQRQQLGRGGRGGRGGRRGGRGVRSGRLDNGR
ncbi:hypothetical protein BC831DRAFT_457446 [Entophlyctis helioformis]|nr:hypothetical protein BC831DRAFT_457446 [Entophlyctis helioformis]